MAHFLIKYTDTRHCHFFRNIFVLYKKVGKTSFYIKHPSSRLFYNNLIVAYFNVPVEGVKYWLTQGPPCRYWKLHSTEQFSTTAWFGLDLCLPTIEGSAIIQAWVSPFSVQLAVQKLPRNNFNLLGPILPLLALGWDLANFFQSANTFNVFVKEICYWSLRRHKANSEECQ